MTKFRRCGVAGCPAVERLLDVGEWGQPNKESFPLNGSAVLGRVRVTLCGNSHVSYAQRFGDLAIWRFDEGGIGGIFLGALLLALASMPEGPLRL